MNIQVHPTSSNFASAMLNSKIRPRAVVGYGVKIFLPSPPNYVTRSPGECYQRTASVYSAVTIARSSFCSMKVQATIFFSQLIAAERAQKASSKIVWILKYAGRTLEFPTFDRNTLHYTTKYAKARGLQTTASELSYGMDFFTSLATLVLFSPDFHIRHFRFIL